MVTLLDASLGRAVACDLPGRYGPYTTAYNRFNRWRKAGVWDRIMDAITAAYDGAIKTGKGRWGELLGQTTTQRLTNVYPLGTLIGMKDVGLRIRVQRELREQFLEACKAQDKPAAQVLREFMREYVAEQEEKKQPAPTRERQ